MTPVLEARGLTKRFPGVLALDNVSFDLREGEIHALCGENGAGKSTLIKTLSGIHPFGSYDGVVSVQGKERHFGGVADSAEAGLAVIYQELALVGEMTVAENIFLGAEPVRGGLIDWQAIYGGADQLLKRFAIAVDPSAKVRDLGTGLQQLVEIVKALAKESRILILDEPTAALTTAEIGVLLNILRDLRSRGISAIYISHKLDEVFALADRITVLRDGASIATLDTAATSQDEVVRLMVGRELGDFYPRRRGSVGDVMLDVRDLSVADTTGAPVLEGISFSVRAGEVLGVGGLMGAGRSEMLMHLFGAWGKRTRGEILLNGKPWEGSNPGAALDAGMAFVTEDRKRYGLHLDQSISFNLSLSSLAKLGRVFIDRPAEVTRNGAMFETLDVKAPSLETRVGTLSGGNQQKVVLGKALLAGPRIVFLDEPTRGIDVGAKVEVYEAINRLTAEGRAVVMVSSEMPELLGMSDRILMLSEGRAGGMFDHSEATPERLLEAAIGSPSP